jgi:hypothetical protein
MGPPAKTQYRQVSFMVIVLSRNLIFNLCQQFQLICSFPLQLDFSPIFFHNRLLSQDGLGKYRFQPSAQQKNKPSRVIFWRIHEKKIIYPCCPVFLVEHGR